MFEPFHPLGARVEKGEPAGQVNFLDDPGRKPEIARFRSAGYLFCRRAPRGWNASNTPSAGAKT